MNVREVGCLVLGAGLQGAGVALELARRGFDVTLVDRDAVPLNRASLRNEGKIHLGLIYANETSRKTAMLMLDSALTFRAIVSRWARSEDEWLATSTPFHYLVSNDSTVPIARLSEHYEAVDARYRELIGNNAALDYLGTRPDRLVRTLTENELGAHFTRARFDGGFATLERAVDTERLAHALRRSVAEASQVEFLSSHVVRTLRRAGDGFVVEGDAPDGAWRIRAQQVVNATWERRLALDAQLGIAPPPDLLHRLKYRVIARLSPALHDAPSVSMVLGRYGDVVIRRDGTAYLSWYPSGLRGWSHDIEPPHEWDSACRGEVDPEEGAYIASEMLENIDAWYPGIARSEPLLVDAGVIVAIGQSDVDDTRSALHGRTRVGVTSHGGYHSVDAGKLTTAPHFALQTADRVALIAQQERPRMRQSAGPRVVALVPTWRAADYIVTTLDALAAQTYPHLEVVISDDASPDETATLCLNRAAQDPRFHVIRQTTNLGWVGNVNALLAEARGDLLLFAFQDDLPEPDYVARCVAALEANPRAVMAFSDIVLVNQDGSRGAKSYATLDTVSDPVARARHIARQDGSWWIPNRGVFRAAAAGAIGGLRCNRAGEFSADWPWLLHMSLLGEFVRVPEALVTKIYMPGSLSRSWDFGARSWLAATHSALGAVARAELPAGGRLSVEMTLLQFAAGRVLRATRQSLGRWSRRVGLRRRVGMDAGPDHRSISSTPNGSEDRRGDRTDPPPRSRQR